MVVRVGAVGCGHIMDHRHLPAFQKIPNAEVVSLCDLNEDLLKKTADKFRVKNYYSDMGDMLKKEELDVVDICTPPKSHVALASLAVEEGCHVLVEKPIAMTVEEVKGMYQKAEKNNASLCVVHQNIFNPAVLKVKQLVDEGQVGDIISVNVSTLVRRDNYMMTNVDHWCHRLPGGIFFELLPHPVYLLQMFLKDIDFDSVVAIKKSESDMIKVDEMRSLLKADGSIGYVISSCNSPYHGDDLFIFGTKMALQVDLWGRSIIKHKVRTDDPVSVGKNNLALSGQLLGVLGTTAANAATMILGGVKVSAHHAFLDEYIKNVETGKELPVSKEEAINNTKIVSDICNGIEKVIN